MAPDKQVTVSDAGLDSAEARRSVAAGLPVPGLGVHPIGAVTVWAGRAGEVLLRKLAD